jgi:hypothetical protein
MTTLTEFLQSTEPHDLKSLALYMSAELKDILLSYQDTLGNIQHKVGPVELVDGRWILCADVLTEIGENGIFHRGFEILPAEMFNLVTVDAMPTAEQFPASEVSER